MPTANPEQGARPRARARTPAAPKPASQTRQKLIAATVRVVARDGLDAASVKTIAAEAGITAGLLHYHFPSKDALLEAALRDALDGYLAQARARRLETPPDRQLDALFGAALAAVEADRDLFRLRLQFATRAFNDPALSAVVRELNGAAIAETALALAQAAGRRTPDRADTDLAATLKAAFDGILLTVFNDPGFPLAAAADLLRALTQAHRPTA